jgi:hypothetical protein
MNFIPDANGSVESIGTSDNIDKFREHPKESKRGKQSQDEVPHRQGRTKPKSRAIPHVTLSEVDENHISDRYVQSQSPILPKPLSAFCHVEIFKEKWLILWRTSVRPVDVGIFHTR